MKSPYRARIARLKKKFNDCRDYSSALLLSSNPLMTRSRDDFHEYRANSNFYYLTGDQSQDLALLIAKPLKRPVLFMRRRTPKELLWDGGLPNMKPLAEELGADLVIADNMRKEILAHLKDCNHLYHDNFPGTLSWSIARELIEIPSHERGNLPLHFSHCDAVLIPARMHKEKYEVDLIRRANEITNEGLLYIAPRLDPGLTEAHAARTIEYVFRMNDAATAFGTIVAGGAEAAVLHHRASDRKLKRGEMVLIDCGAEYKLYCGDITRVVPCGGTFSPEQRDVYEVVLAAQKAALKNVRAGVKIAKAYDAAARVMTEGLIELKVLRGKASELFEKKAFLPYFPHGIGHSLGIDVHDVGNLRGNKEATLEAGMVITVEPGLYFPKKIGKVPACGVRIEDNVLVTAKGCEILSAGFPKELSEIEALAAQG